MAKVKMIPRVFGEIPEIKCHSCGIVFRKAIKKTILRMPYCGNCRKRIEDAAQNYCGHCGERIEWDEQRD